MFFRTFTLIGCVFVIVLIAHAQDPVKKTPSASISGKVSVKGKGIAGIMVAARPTNSRGRPTPAVSGMTDEQGNYRLSNLAAGEFEIGPAAPQFVVISLEPMKRLLLNDGDNAEGIDFTLVRGGVITGKVVDSEGRPLIEEQVEIQSEGPYTLRVMSLNGMSIITDDRGVYRVFGLAPGKYKVAAGTDEDRLNYNTGRRTVYVQTFHPSTTDKSQATTIEVTEGSETKDVDITLRRSQPTYSVSVKVVDADSGQPLPDMRVGVQKFSEHGSSGMGGPPTNRKGEIRIENLTPGKYAVSLEGFMRSRGSMDSNTPRYAEPVNFEIVDQDIAGLVIKASSGASLSGVVSFEGTDEKVLNAKLNELMLFAHIRIEDRRANRGAPASMVGADGSFSVGGLQAGTVTFSVWPQRSGKSGEVDVVRIERNGVIVPRLEIKEREQLNGLRLILKWRSGQIRGVVKFENEELRSGGPVYVNFKKQGDEAASTVPVDERGRFQSSPLSAGVYEVLVIAYSTRPQNGPFPTAKQQVVVTDNQVTEVMLTLDFKTSPTTDRP